MKSRTLTCITAIMLFAALDVPVQLAAQVGGIGITNRIPIWTNSTTLGNSNMFQTGGKVGIGTTTPTATLTVIGANGATSGTIAPNALQVTGGSGAVGFLGINAGAGGPITLTAGPGGHAGRSGSNGGPGGSVLIAGGNGGSGTTCCAGGNGKGGSIILQPGAGGTFVIPGPPGNVILAPTRGRVGIGTTNPQATLDVATGFSTLADAWITRSSRRFKTNIQPLEGALEKIEQLQGVSYERKGDGKHEIGVVAEDVAQIVPEVVSRDPKTHEVQGVDYSRLAAVLIEAVKAQQAELQSQKAEIQELKARIEGQ